MHKLDRAAREVPEALPGAVPSYARLPQHGRDRQEILGEMDKLKAAEQASGRTASSPAPCITATRTTSTS